MIFKLVLLLFKIKNYKRVARRPVVLSVKLWFLLRIASYLFNLFSKQISRVNNLSLNLQGNWTEWALYAARNWTLRRNWRRKQRSLTMNRMKEMRGQGNGEVQSYKTWTKFMLDVFLAEWSFMENLQSQVNHLHINKSYIISKCIEDYEGPHTSAKRSLLIAIKFQAVSQIRII